MKKLLTALTFLLALFFVAYLLSLLQPPTPPTAENPLPEGWVEGTSSEGLIFNYPESLGTTYISTAEWPPQVAVLIAYACPTNASSTEPFFQVAERMIDGKTYCVAALGEGAAGSTYVTYEYVTDRGDAVLWTSFTLRYVQCQNYDEPERSACVAEQDAANTDPLAAVILETMRLPK